MPVSFKYNKMWDLHSETVLHVICTTSLNAPCMSVFFKMEFIPPLTNSDSFPGTVTVL